MESSQRPVRVVVVDDHPFFRDGITRGLTFTGRIAVVGEAGNGREALEVITREQPDVAVVDYQMPDIDGIGVVHAVNRDGLGTKVILLSAETGSAVVFKALEEGAKGYLSKDSSREQIVEAVMTVARGGTVVPPELTAGLAEQIRLRSQPDAPALSQREQEVLRGFAQGLSIPQLAAELFIGVSTVKTHTQRLYEKLGVSDRAAAVAEGMRRGLLE
ncbi:response regulator transcription factor [Rathayibacter soli]|uniref:response regulator transcription factor n=1 Tax=Rathayibacter soli TaxID=3144168 RepID=UPI0027E3F67D|nr:response regulator transcription factor [Glaciibacter superstes]